MTLKAGDEIGIYKLHECIDENNKGRTTYLAETTGKSSVPEKKVILVFWPTNAPHYKREHELLMTIRHPSIPRPNAICDYEDYNYFVMDYHEGPTLEETVQINGKLPTDYTMQALLPISDALAHCHEKEVIHRSIRPTNILLGERVYLLGLGTAKKTDGATADSSESILTLVDPYLAPELLASQPHTFKTDMYALGITLAYCLLGQIPHMFTLSRIKGEIQPIVIQTIPELERLTNSLINPNPEERPTAKETKEKIQKLLN